eukprot:4695023-Pleurochrysis_carterae.AAC.1
MKLHVAGVIIYGVLSDRIHLFSTAPNLVGNANLNIECLYLAFNVEFKNRGVLPELHVQEGVPGSKVHPILTYVHAWDDFFRPAIYYSVLQITTARVFILRQRDDSCTCSA